MNGKKERKILLNSRENIPLSIKRGRDPIGTLSHYQSVCKCQVDLLSMIFGFERAGESRESRGFIHSSKIDTLFLFKAPYYSRGKLEKSSTFVDSCLSVAFIKSQFSQ